MKRKKIFAKLNRGFSLTEVIISMTLVVMISAIGYLACALATKIGTDGEKEVKGYADAEKFYLCLSSAYESVDGNYAQKDEYLSALVASAEWYFRAEGLSSLVAAQTLNGGEWTEQVLIAGTEEKNDGNFGVYYYGAENGTASYAFRLFSSDAEHETSCYVNCRTAEVRARVEARKPNANLAFYEKTYRFAGR